MKLARWGVNTVRIIKDREGSDRVKVKVVSGPGLTGQTLLVSRNALEEIKPTTATLYANKPPSPVYHLTLEELTVEEGVVKTSPGKTTLCGLKITGLWDTYTEPQGTLCMRCKRENESN